MGKHAEVSMCIFDRCFSEAHVNFQRMFSVSIRFIPNLFVPETASNTAVIPVRQATNVPA